MKAYIPEKLKQEALRIREIHKQESLPRKLLKSSELRLLIETIVSMRASEIESYALALTDKEVLMVAGYIPYNYYLVDMSNLFTVYKICSSKKGADYLYLQWLDSYNNTACNKFIQGLLKNDTDFISLISSKNLKPDRFSKLLNSSNLPLEFGQMVQNQSSTGSLAKRLAYYGLDASCYLYKDIERLYYTFCNKAEYLSVNQMDLVSVVSKYSTDEIKKFLLNFLGKLDLGELGGFRTLAKHIESAVGAPGSNRAISVIGNFSMALRQKYNDWINIFRVERYFGSDERSVFWEHYRFLSVERMSRSDCVVMEFNDYYVLEFLGYAAGPMYFFRKENYKNHVLWRAQSFEKADLKSWLYHNQVYSMWRKAHQGNWQRMVHETIIRYRITEIIYNRYSAWWA